MITYHLSLTTAFPYLSVLPPATVQYNVQLPCKFVFESVEPTPSSAPPRSSPPQSHLPSLPSESDSKSPPSSSPTQPSASTASARLEWLSTVLRELSADDDCSATLIHTPGPHRLPSLFRTMSLTFLQPPSFPHSQTFHTLDKLSNAHPSALNIGAAPGLIFVPPTELLRKLTHKQHHLPGTHKPHRAC